MKTIIKVSFANMKKEMENIIYDTISSYFDSLQCTLYHGIVPIQSMQTFLAKTNSLVYHKWNDIRYCYNSIPLIYFETHYFIIFYSKC